MRLLKYLPIFLLNLSVRARIIIVVLSYPPCLYLYARIFVHTGAASVAVIPILFAAWLFGFRGALLFTAVTSIFVCSLNYHVLGSLFWTQDNLTRLFVGTSTAILIGIFVAYVRQSTEMVASARLKAFQAEQEKSVAYAQRLEALRAERQMELAYEQQLRLHQLKDEFILNVNHELRTPITAVHGYLELLTSCHEQLDANVQMNFLHSAMEGCEELMQLVNNVLDAANVSNQVQLAQVEELSVLKVVNDVFEHMEPHIKQEYRIQIAVSEFLTVCANEQFFRRVLRNLLSNAVKYSPRQTTVLVSAALTETHPQEVCISIKDSGPGIPPDEIPLLFEKFVRLKRDLSGPVRGTGLGLYISKQLVSSMGGRIWIESTGRAGEGSCFCFTLPCPASHSINNDLAPLVQRSQRDSENTMALSTSLDQ